MNNYHKTEMNGRENCCWPIWHVTWQFRLSMAIPSVYVSVIGPTKKNLTRNIGSNFNLTCESDMYETNQQR